MTTEVIDKLMKPYWDEKFDNTYLGDFYKENSGWRDDWYGVIIKKTDKLIVGCSIKDKDWWDDVTWFYDGKIFLNGDILFGLGKHQFNMAMLRYINKKYNLNVKQVC